MAIGETSLASLADGTDRANGNVYTVPSSSPVANTLILLAVGARLSATAAINTPTVSGFGATWVLVDSYNGFEGSTRSRIWLFRTMLGTGQTGTVTINPANGTTAWSGCGASLKEFTGVDTSGTNGSGAVVQSVTGAGPTADSGTISLTLAAFGSSNNRPYMLGGVRDNAVTFAPETNWTEIHEAQPGNGNFAIATAWRSDATDTTPSMSFSGASSDPSGGLAIEIKAAVDAPAGGHGLLLSYARNRLILG
jgi:hypothetical protein